jgi:NhaA family Na+:H+ antiporter
VLGFVAGVGFTMALFIADLAFLNVDHLAAAKLGMLAASLGAAVVALVLVRGAPFSPADRTCRADC